jgi:hypothetical protein
MIMEISDARKEIEITGDNPKKVRHLISIIAARSVLKVQLSKEKGGLIEGLFLCAWFVY